MQAQTLLQAQGAALPVGLRVVHGARETCPSAHGGVQAADLWAARHCLGLPPLHRLLQTSPQGLSPQPRLLQPSPQARGGHESVGGKEPYFEAGYTAPQGLCLQTCRRVTAPTAAGAGCSPSYPITVTHPDVPFAFVVGRPHGVCHWTRSRPPQPRRTTKLPSWAASMVATPMQSTTVGAACRHHTTPHYHGWREAVCAVAPVVGQPMVPEV